MRNLLMILAAFIVITAVPCGLMMMIKPDGSLLQLDINLISHSFLRNYFVPGVALTFFAGGINLLALWMLWKNKKHGLFCSIAGGLMMIAFEVVQIAVIQTFSWLQLVYLLCGFFMVLIALQLKHKELI
ncbi:MAG: hypothetical protein QM725_02005 [Lacibacter sp.]